VAGRKVAGCGPAAWQPVVRRKVAAPLVPSRRGPARPVERPTTTALNLARTREFSFGCAELSAYAGLSFLPSPIGLNSALRPDAEARVWGR